MVIIMSRSKLRVKSNIIQYSKYHAHPCEFIKYIPYNLLPKEYKDDRIYYTLTTSQKNYCDAMLFYTDKIVKVENVLDEEDLRLLGLFDEN